MKKELTISIKGETASGKSRILFLIKNMLIENGFDVDHMLNEDHPTETNFNDTMLKNLNDAVNTLKEKTKIKIVEKQTSIKFHNNGRK